MQEAPGSCDIAWRLISGLREIHAFCAGITQSGRFGGNRVVSHWVPWSFCEPAPLKKKAYSPPSLDWDSKLPLADVSSFRIYSRSGNIIFHHWRMLLLALSIGCREIFGECFSFFAATLSSKSSLPPVKKLMKWKSFYRSARTQAAQHVQIATRMKAAIGNGAVRTPCYTSQVDYSLGLPVITCNWVRASGVRSDMMVMKSLSTRR